MKNFKIKALFLSLFISCAFITAKSANSLLTPPPPPTEYYTITGGDLIANIWSLTSHAGASCGCTPDGTCDFVVPANTIIYIAHAVTTGCNINIGSNATIVIENGGSLTVTGNANISGTGFFQIDAGGSAVVTGNFTVSGTGDATINGSLAVGGDLTLGAGGGSLICGSGTIAVSGSVTGIPDPCFTGSLPIELLFFTGDLMNTYVDIKWATASETNNDYFTVQRSQDGQHWSNLMIVSGAGNSVSTINYQRVDENPLLGVSYYKLRQTDYDGEFTESNIVAINNNNGVEADIIPFPNPTIGNEIGLEILGFDDEQLSIVVTNVLGKIEYVNSYKIVGNTAQLKIDFNNRLATGTYFVTGSSSKQTISKKLVIK
jgi:Secretion system C-terminal sorting domain